MVNYITTDAELTSIADAIRAKGGTSDPMAFPDWFVSAVEAIPRRRDAGQPVRDGERRIHSIQRPRIQRGHGGRVRGRRGHGCGRCAYYADDFGELLQ